MPTCATPDHPTPAPAPGVDPGLASRLLADAYYHLVRKLRLTLPPPLGMKPGPDDLARRDHAAIARIAALAPANAAEADVAAMFVVASEQWTECLRLAQAPDATPERAAKYRAQAGSMMREANSAMRLLLRMQDARRKLEADPAACDRLAWTEHCAINLMAEALAAQPAIPEPASEPAEKPAAVVEETQPEPAPLTGSLASIRRQETDPILIAAADRYAVAFPSAPPTSAAPARCRSIAATSTRPRTRSPPR